VSSKVKFFIEPNEYGFPPVRDELLDAIELPGGLLRLEDAAYFAEGVAYHDVVEAVPTGVPGEFAFVRVVGKSDFVPMSILLLHDDVDDWLMGLLRANGCVIAYGVFGAYRMLAVAVPPQAAFAPLREQLLALEELGRISVAELNRCHAFDA
jgi:hypothetical protein